MTNISLNIIDELSIIFLWIGIWGITDMFINLSINEYKHYIYILLILIAIYFKL